jgi:dolichyl-phosphate-mannose-protein mannosyltransferase
VTATRPSPLPEEGSEEREPEALEGAVSQARAGFLLSRLGLERPDLLVMGALLAVAFFFRFASPLMPDFLAHPLEGAPISNCVHSTPVDQRGNPGTLCGLAYPYQPSYAQNGQPPSPPNGQVFDEIYFAVFAHNDLKGISYFDPEPPLSKLIIASGQWLYGWWRATFEGAHGSYADLGFNTFGWRIMSAIFGSLCVPLMYLLAYKLWPRRLFALAAATLVCFDGMFFVQSRIGMIDIFPIFLILLAYTAFLVHLESRGERDALISLLLVGVVCGLAVSAKWISLAATASIVFFLVMRPLARHVSLALGGGERPWRWGSDSAAGLPGGARAGPYLVIGLLAFIVIPTTIYLASWFPFFMRGQFHTLGDLIEYNRQSFEYHAHLTAGHPWGSPWFSWPFLYRPVAYYYQYEGLGTDAASGHALFAGMSNLGNPIIWWASLPAVLSLPYFVFRHRSFPAAVILVGFLTQYLPWARITRVLFLYHMFGGLVFMILALAFVLVRMQDAGPLRIEFFGDRARLSMRWLVPVFLSVAVLFFLYFYPVWTALPISDVAYRNGFPAGKMWVPTWF